MWSTVAYFMPSSSLIIILHLLSFSWFLFALRIFSSLLQHEEESQVEGEEQQGWPGECQDAGLECPPGCCEDGGWVCHGQGSLPGEVLV